MKRIAYGFAAILMVFAIIVPGYASTSATGPNGGTCRTVTGNVSGPNSDPFTTTQTGTLQGNGSPTTLTYVVEDQCLIENAIAADSAVVDYMISATCMHGTDTSAINCPTDAGTIGVQLASANACNNPPAATEPICIINSEVAGTSAVIPLGASTTILTANATVNEFPNGKAGTVAQLGTVSINVPVDFGPVTPPEFSIAFEQ